MGQAKSRGTFEERQAQGIARRQREELERQLRIAEREARMTPHERAERDKMRLLLAGMHAIVMDDPAMRAIFGRRLDALLL